MGPGYHLRAGCGWDRRPRAGSPDPVGPGQRDLLPRRVDVSRAPGCLENYDGNHYYVSDVGEQLMLTTIGTVVVSASVALLVLIVVTLPIIVTRMPADVAGETRLRRISSARTRKVSISLIVYGLSVFLLGGLLLVATRGTDRIAPELEYVWQAMKGDAASTEELVWFLGIIVAAAGAAAMVAGAALFLIAVRAAGRGWGSKIGRVRGISALHRPAAT